MSEGIMWRSRLTDVITSPSTYNLRKVQRLCRWIQTRGLAEVAQVLAELYVVNFTRSVRVQHIEDRLLVHVGMPGLEACRASRNEVFTMQEEPRFSEKLCPS